jgi:ketosteroid isomerase-like protein
VKYRVIILCMAVLSIVAASACDEPGVNRNAGDVTVNANSAANSDTKTGAKPTVDEIREVLVAHDKALNEKNLDALMATFSTDPNTVVLGTGTEERWVGPQEIRTAYTEIFKDYDPGTLQTKCDWKTGGGDDAGTMAWLAASCDAKDSLQGKAREYKLNVTGTVEKQDGKWRFVALHMSNAFQPPVTK